MKDYRHHHGFSLAEKTGAIALLLAFLLGVFAPPYTAAVPLVLFVIVCLSAPFLPRWSFYLPVIYKGKQGADGIALTFDDGPFPASTPLLLDLLAQYQLPATFFVIGKNAAAHPELIEAILSHGHTIGNHSYRHDNLFSLRSYRNMKQDLLATQDILAKAGIRPLVFRPPIGITSPRLQPVLASLGLQTITFSCRAFDRGNRNIRDLSSRVLRLLQPGDILLLHDNPPLSDKAKTEWFNELQCLFVRLHQSDQVVPLATLIGCPVMAVVTKQPDCQR